MLHASINKALNKTRCVWAKVAEEPVLGIPVQFLAPLLPPNVSALVFFAATHPIMAALQSAALQDGEVAGVSPQSDPVHVI